MKTLTALALALMLAGCGTIGSKPGLVQQALDKLLPADFTGDFKGGYKIPAYLSINIEAQGLRRTEKGWTFTYADYTRDGPMMSYAHFTLGVRK